MDWTANSTALSSWTTAGLQDRSADDAPESSTGAGASSRIKVQAKRTRPIASHWDKRSVSVCCRCYWSVPLSLRGGKASGIVLRCFGEAKDCRRFCALSLSARPWIFNARPHRSEARRRLASLALADFLTQGVMDTSDCPIASPDAEVTPDSARGREVVG